MSTEVVKPNDSGIDLKEAKLPEPIGIMDAPAEQTPAPDPVPKEPQRDPVEVARQAVIACEDRVKRRELIMTIQRYYASRRFAKFLVECDLVEELSQKTMPEMKQLLRDVRFAIQNRNTSEMIQKGVPQAICAIEPLICRYVNIKGTGIQLEKSEVFRDLLEEVALENQMFSDSPASTRLSLEILKTMFFVNGYHRAMEEQKKLQEAKEKPVSLSQSTKEML
jgi:hypothetical protein